MKISKEELKEMVREVVLEQASSKYRRPEEDQDYWSLRLEPGPKNPESLSPGERKVSSINRLRQVADRMEKVLHVSDSRMKPGTGSPGDEYSKEVEEALLKLDKFARMVEYEAKNVMMEWP